MGKFLLYFGHMPSIGSHKVLLVVLQNSLKLVLNILYAIIHKIDRDFIYSKFLGIIY